MNTTILWHDSAPKLHVGFSRVGAVTIGVVALWRYVEVTTLAKDFFPFDVPDDASKLTD